MTIFQVLVPLGGVGAGLALIFFVNWVVAPRRQIEDLRKASSGTPSVRVYTPGMWREKGPDGVVYGWYLTIENPSNEYPVSIRAIIGKIEKPDPRVLSPMPAAAVPALGRRWMDVPLLPPFIRIDPADQTVGWVIFYAHWERIEDINYDDIDWSVILVSNEDKQFTISRDQPFIGEIIRL